MKALSRRASTASQADFARLPVENASVDAVLAVNVAYFMDDAAELAESHRVLVPWGRLVLDATHANTRAADVSRALTSTVCSMRGHCAHGLWPLALPRATSWFMT